MANWASKGFDEVDAIPDIAKQNRFFLKEGEERQIIFLEEDPLYFWEHQVRMNGDWRYYLTCLKNINQPCPLCDAKIKRYQVGVFSIIEVTEYVNAKGEKVKNPVKIMAIKNKALKVLKRHGDKKRILNGKFNVYRSEKQAGSSGDVFEFEECVNPLDYNPTPTKIDFDKLCKPMATDVLRTVAGMAEPDEYAAAGTAATPVAVGVPSTVDSDDVPF